MKLLDELANQVIEASKIDKELFEKYNVKRGLRNADGSGVLVGLTSIGDVVGYEKIGDKITPKEGKLFYRGIELMDFVHGFQKDGRHGFDEAAFLLLTGKLPTQSELEEFSKYLVCHRDLPSYFTKRFFLPKLLLISDSFPSNTFLLLLIIKISSQSFSALSMTWVEKIMVVPFSFNSSKMSLIRF